MTTHRILFFLSLLLSCTGVFSQTTSENYIRIRTYTAADSSSWRDRIVYYDDLGREEQTVLVGASPSGGDVVTLKEYDDYGRLEKVWNAAAVSGNAGGHVDINTLKALAIQSNGNDSKPYALTVYEPSPLDRPLRQYGAGSDWHQHDRYVGTSYHTNISGDSRLDCIRFTATQSGSSAVVTVTHHGSYATGSLTVVCTTGEDCDTTYEFRDLNGEVVLLRRMLDGRCLDTYYVRDEWGNIMAVLPPQASSQMTASGSSWSSSSEILRDYAYLYCYDYRYREIAKKLPGCVWEYTVYDKSDTPVFRQDGNLRQKGLWQYTLCDVLGRTCVTGTCRNTLDAFANPLTVNVTAVQSGSHYDPAGITLTGNVRLQQTFYDTYETASSANAYVEGSGYGERSGTSAKGQVTHVKSAMLGGNTPSSAINRVFYYDYRDRVVQTQGNSHDGYHEAEYVSYDFSGNAVARKLVHADYYTQHYTYDYDGWGRQTEKRYKNNMDDWVTLADNTYDALGRLSANQRNGSVRTDYAYNVRSWPTSIQSESFSQRLYYNILPSTLPSIPRYGGSVAAMEWDLNAETHSYRFTYDALDRLLTSSYDNTLDMEGYFDTEYEYDDHGNLTYIGRYAQSATPNLCDKVDDLTLTYDGNRLVDISQGSDADDFYDYTPYGDPSATSGLCTYDQNGNMTSNRRKGIASVAYNLLNLPDVITFTDGSIISYAYDITGEKRRVVYSTAASTMEQPVAASLQSGGGTVAQIQSGSGSVTTTVDYCGSLIFQSGIRYIRLEDDGIWDGLHGGYCFYVKDHLGNIRSVHNQYGACIQTSQYYPFGKIWDDFNWNGSTQPFRFSGKELDKMHGLEWYDFVARMYEPGLGRFTGMDSRAEDYYDTSPYVYCLNNPLKNIDPDGRGVWSRGAKLLRHVGKSVAKNGLKALNTAETYTSAFSDIKESVNTLMDANASTADKIMAGISLASEFAPVSVEDAKEVGKVVKSTLHGNSKASTKAQHAYDIINTETEKVVKTGVSGGSIRKDGKSVRAETQATKWNKEARKDIYKSEITHYEPAGEGARVRILEYEKERATILREGDHLTEGKHKRP